MNLCVLRYQESGELGKHSLHGLMLHGERYDALLIVIKVGLGGTLGLQLEIPVLDFVSYWLPMNSGFFLLDYEENKMVDIVTFGGKTKTPPKDGKITGNVTLNNCNPKSSHDDGSKSSSDDGKNVDEDPRKDSECKDQEKEDNVNSTNNVNIANNVNIVSSTVNAAGTNEVNAVVGKTSIELPYAPTMPALEYDNIFGFSRDDEDDGAVADINNLDTTIQVSPNLTTRIHKDHPLDQEEPKKAIHALKDPSWIEAMQDELLQFKLQEVWTLVDLPNGKRAIGSKWVFRNKKDEKGIMIRNKARLIKEEVYVCQPPGFEDLDFPDRVYKVEKALYRLNKLLELVYVDDIIFGSTKNELCDRAGFTP
ncbi:putative ribonuclease H-like domain-containing protein [Tanacetum coccineum]|uniref:Ribonuclease H-like domain-containing protein n=1 Tax=Tanacetum coccineum TaxID=301880 RepID=A0ABQ5C5C3_9ASTR